MALSQVQARLFAQAIANHRRLEELLQQMRELSQIAPARLLAFENVLAKNISNRP